MKSRENAAGEACFFTITTAVLAGLCLAVAPTEVRAMQDEDVLENRTSLAWMRFDDDGRQEYKGVRYRWLGDGDITLHVDVAPDPSHVFAFRWGAKNDQRDAALRICGEKIDLHHGGYEGFRWFIVPVPKKAKGSAYTLHLVAGSRSPAFFAEIRLLAPGDVGSVALSRRSHRMTAKFGIRTRPHPFPERRARWEAEVSRRPGTSDTVEERRFLRAATNGVRANEQFFRCRRFVDGWLRHADRKTGLIPRNLGRDKGIWNAQDAAADNYPFMVLTCALTDRPMFEGRMLDMLRTETRLTSRLGRLPDTWSFAKQAFQSEKPDLSGIIFGGSEYVKDGLLPLTEWLGPSPWSERMLGIVDDLWKHAPIETPYGRIPSTNVEVNGEMLQALSRIYWMTGEARFFEYAKRLGDYYLLGDHHPTRDFSSLRLRDHGCEIVSGLSELYAAVHFADPKRKKAYREPIHAIFDRILEIGRNEHGLLYNTINPRAGTTGRGLCDTWGYNYNGVYTVYLLDGTETYRDAVRKVLG
ncbi:MAG: hypothetical protein CMJ83_22015, partial [Planctomycetes bacterium]|nr:hypothetical protein [Planctomycetota bacterium]